MRGVLGEAQSSTGIASDARPPRRGVCNPTAHPGTLPSQNNGAVAPVFMYPRTVSRCRLRAGGLMVQSAQGTPDMATRRSAALRNVAVRSEEGSLWGSTAGGGGRG